MRGYIAAAWVATILLSLPTAASALSEDTSDSVQGPGAAAPGAGQVLPVIPAARPPAAVLADANGNGLSDGLDARLAGMGPNALVDVIVTFSGPGSAAGTQRAVGAFDVTREYHLISGFAATLSARQARALAGTPGVFRVEEHFTVYANIEAARLSFGVDKAVADFGYMTGSGVVTGDGITVCVVDTGIHAAHEQFVDESTLVSKVAAFVDFVGDLNGVIQTAPYDDNGHGTHVAATAVGDGTGLSEEAALLRGVAPGATVKSAKVITFEGTGPDSAVIAGIEWCVDQGDVDVINLSLGVPGNGDGKGAMDRAVDKAVKAGVFVAVAAGNAGAAPNTVGMPAGSKLGFTVGAAAEWLGDPSVNPSAIAWQSKGVYPAPFSSRGPTKDGRIKPDIMAPGVTIASAISNPSYLADPIGFILGWEFACGDACYFIMSGTSMATPFVAGVAALMLETNPALTPAGIRQIMTDTAQGWNAIPGQDNEIGYGLLDAYSAIAEAAGAVAYDPTPYPNYSADTGSVADVSETLVPIDVAASDVGHPLAVTVTIDGEFLCYEKLGNFCFSGAWEPDLHTQLLDPNLDPIVFLNPLYPKWGPEYFIDPESISTCPSGNECGQVGRQETMHFVPAVAGTYHMKVAPWHDPIFHYGTGGTFTYEVSHGPVMIYPTAEAGPDQTVPDSDGDGVEMVTLDASVSSGAIVSYIWTNGSIDIPDVVEPTVEFGLGTHEVFLEVVNDLGVSALDAVTVTVGDGGGGGGKKGGGGRKPCNPKKEVCP